MSKILLSPKGDKTELGYYPAQMIYSNKIERPFIALDEICAAKGIDRIEALKEPFTYDHIPNQIGFLIPTGETVENGDEIFIPVYVKPTQTEEQKRNMIIPEPVMVPQKKYKVKAVDYIKPSKGGGAYPHYCMATVEFV